MIARYALWLVATLSCASARVDAAAGNGDHRHDINLQCERLLTIFGLVEIGEFLEHILGPE